MKEEKVSGTAIEEASVLHSMSEVMFPQSRQLPRNEPPRFFATNTQILSSYPLQMLLYFNLQFSLVYFIIELPLFIWKVNNAQLNSWDQIVVAILLFLWAIVEPTRLYFGYAGNLREKVPTLAGFILLSVFQTLIPIYFFLRSKFPFDICIHILSETFLVPEIVLSIVTARKFIRVQAARFYLTHWSVMENQHDALEMNEMKRKT